MPDKVKNKIIHSACPHDCPSTCALDVELLGAQQIGRVRGSKDNSYTDGVICAKVARYAERIHHPDRLIYPLKRTGPRGSGQYARIGWDAAMETVASAFIKAENEYGPESIWPYYYAGTMGLVMRDGIERLRNARGYTATHNTLCTSLAWTGYRAGTGALRGADPREMADSDVIILWGTNPVHTQINVMRHAGKARKNRGAKIVVVDIYQNASMKQADLAVCLKPGTDGALASAVMHIAFRDGRADRQYMARYCDDPQGLEAHLKDKTPEWAAAITGLSVAEIEGFADLVTRYKRTFFRLGYGFSRSRNGAVNMHAVLSIPAVTGAWTEKGGGAFHSNSGFYKSNKTMIEGLDMMDSSIRKIDQCRLGDALLGDPEVLAGGPPVKVLFVQNNNPVNVAPDQNKVRAGMLREDLFICVHEQFMTDTAKMADIILPATAFLEHDDIYQSGGHQHLTLGPKALEPPGECRNNHQVICDLAARLGADQHPGFSMSPRAHIDWLLKASGRGNLTQIEKDKWVICQPPFEDAHFLTGFGHADGKFHFRPDWDAPAGQEYGPDICAHPIPAWPDHWPVIEEVNDDMPFRLATSPARNFLNSTFGETETSRKNEHRPTVLIHPQDAKKQSISDGQIVRLGNNRGEIRLHARLFDGLQTGVLISEGLWPNSLYLDGQGINSLTGSDPGGPVGGGCFHDNRVWIRGA